MPQEIPKQRDMFTGELVDIRTPAQKRRERASSLPQPTPMFSQRDIAQFGLTSRPLLPISPHTRLALMAEDHRSEEEIAQDTQREAQRRTASLFPEPTPRSTPLLPAWCATTVWEQTIFRPALSSDPDGTHQTISTLVERTQSREPLLLSAGPMSLIAAEEPVTENTSAATSDEDFILYQAGYALNLAYSLV
jgi:hypothetical protein